ncbi:MAG: hypothetical protein AAGC81_04150 [Pseudomonadota bacterium]
MQFVVYAGAGLALLGVGLLISCMLKARRLARAATQNAEAETELRKLITLNMAGVGLGFFGLAIVLVGVMFG